MTISRRYRALDAMFRALEAAQRQYDPGYEVRDYLKNHPEAAVVNMGCGLDDTSANASIDFTQAV